MPARAQSKWEKRDQRRAEILHGIFCKVAVMGLTYRGMFRQARKLAGTGRFLNSYSRFESLFLAWRKKPCAETLTRKWNPHMHESSAEFVPAVVAFAIAARMTLREAHSRIGLPLSYNTVFRHCKIRLEIARLAAIRRAQERLGAEEQRLRKKITGRNRL